jgi:Tfp pilus assembly PilM family ATPase
MKLPRLLRTPPPAVAVEITPSRVAAVEVSGDRAGSFRVTRFAVEPVAAGVVVPSLNSPNIEQPAALAQALKRLWDQLGHRPDRVALVVPDGVAKVSFVRFQQVPAKASDLDELIRFQIKKAAPFRIEESQVSYSKGMLTPDGQEFVVVQARRDLIGEYEAACQSAGATAGVVDLATFNVANAVMAGDTALSGDWLLVHVSDGGAALAIHRGPDTAFFRHRGNQMDATLGDLVHQTAMFYQDRIGGTEFSRVLVAGGTQPDGPQTARKTIEARLGRPVEPVDPMKAVSFADRSSLSPDLADALTAAIGLAIALRTADPAGGA